MTPLNQCQNRPERGETVGSQTIIDKESIIVRHGKKSHDKNNANDSGSEDKAKANDIISSHLANDAAPLKRKKRARHRQVKKPNSLAKASFNQNLEPKNQALSLEEAHKDAFDKTTVVDDKNTIDKNIVVDKNNLALHEAESYKKRRRKKHQNKQLNSTFEKANATILANKSYAHKAKATKTKLTEDAKKQQNSQNISMQTGQIPPMPLYAALDLGTNNCRLLIASPTRPGHFRVVDAFSRIVRLGEGLATTGRLHEKAMDRAIEALKICANKLKHKNIKRQRFIATEACRSAVNGSAFIQRVFDETGLELEIVDRETEARLAVSGCGTLVEKGTNAIVLFDIGGGSSEIALIDISKRRSPRLAEHITAWTSLPVGVVTLAERFGGVDVSKKDFAKMKDHVGALLRNFSERYMLGDLTNSPHFHLMGTSGTVTTLAGIHLDLERYDRRQIDGVWMNSADVSQMTTKLLSMNMAERVANPCIGQDRADLVLAGCAILEAIREVWPSERLRVADRGLREGILTELMSRDGAWRRKKYRLGHKIFHKNFKPQRQIS